MIRFICSEIHLTRRGPSVKKICREFLKVMSRNKTTFIIKKHRNDKNKHYQSLLLSIKDLGISGKWHRGVFISLIVAASSFLVTGR
jgi:hypothetical protein